MPISRHGAPRACFFIFVTALCAPLPAEAQWSGDLAVEALYNDNLSRAELARHAHGDLGVSASAHGAYHFQPGDFTGLTVAGTASRTRFDTYRGLDSTEAGFALALAHKFGLGDRVPELAIDTSASRATFGTGIRNAWIYGIGLSLNRRLADGLRLTASLRQEWRDGDSARPKTPPPAPKPGSAWTYDTLTAGLEAEIDLGPATWLTAAVRYQRGDVVSSSPGYPKIVAAAVAITNDPVFGPDVIAYRLPASTRMYGLELNRAVLDTATLYIGTEYQDTAAAYGIDYPVTLVRAGFIYGF